MRITLTVLVAIACITFASQARVVFELNSANFDNYLKNGATKQGEVATLSQPNSCIDFANNGILQIPGILFPQGAFSIESRFNLKEYAVNDPVISDLLGGYDCDYDGNGSTEGVNFRVGGGYNYPLCTENVFHNLEEYVHPINVTERSTLSKCIGELAIGVGKHIWKEVYSDRCIETNTWTHMVTTWDGKKMKLFLNGIEATDEWRTIAADEPVFVKDTTTLVFGAERLSDLNRHFNGKIDFLRIYDNALTLDEIKDRYNEKSDKEECSYQLIITSPKAGEVITSSSKLSFAVIADKGCSLSVFPDRFKVQVATDPEFKTIILNATTNSLENIVSLLLKGNKMPDEGVVFIRVSVESEPKGLSKKTGTSKLVLSAPQPVYFIPTTTAVSGKQLRQLSSLKAGTGLRNDIRAVYDCRGQKVRLSSDASFSKGLHNGIYFIDYKVKSMHTAVQMK